MRERRRRVGRGGVPEACLAACERAGAAADRALEASARHEPARGTPPPGILRAAELQTAYLRACEISGDERGEGAARQARAYARRDAGDAAGAERDLLQFLAPEGAERRGRELRRERERKTEARLENVRRRNEKGNDGSGDRLLGGTPEDTFDADELELLVAEARGWRALGKMQSARGGAADAALSREKFFELATVRGQGYGAEARVCQARGRRQAGRAHARGDGARRGARRAAYGVEERRGILLRRVGNAETRRYGRYRRTGNRPPVYTTTPDATTRKVTRRYYNMYLK